MTTMNPRTVDECFDRLHQINAELGRLQAHDELTSTQERRFRELQNEFDEVDEERKRLERAEGLARIRDGLRDGSVVTEPGADPGRPNPDDDRPSFTQAHPSRDAARRRLDGLRSVPDHGRERLTKMFQRAEADAPGVGSQDLDLMSRWLLVTCEPAYARAVVKLFRDPVNGHREFTRDELAAYQDAKGLQRAMSLGAGTADFLVPTHLDPNVLLTNVGAVDPVRALARSELIAGTQWNGVTSAGVTASWDAEGVEVSDDTPVLAQAPVPVHKAAAFVPITIEAYEDAANVEGQVGEMFVDAKQRIEAVAFLDGTGSGQPTGLVTSLPAGSKVATTTADVLVSADVTKPAVALPPRWQPRAAYIANNATAIAIGAFETAGGALRYGEINATPPTLLRKPFHEHSGMETAGATAAAGNDSVLLLGDFQQYLCVDRIGMTVEFIPHLFDVANNRPSGSRGWYAYWRVGGDVLVDDAFRLMTA